MPLSRSSLSHSSSSSHAPHLPCPSDWAAQKLNRLKLGASSHKSSATQLQTLKHKVAKHTARITSHKTKFNPMNITQALKRVRIFRKASLAACCRSCAWIGVWELGFTFGFYLGHVLCFLDRVECHDAADCMIAMKVAHAADVLTSQIQQPGTRAVVCA